MRNIPRPGLTRSVAPGVKESLRRRSEVTSSLERDRGRVRVGEADDVDTDTRAVIEQCLRGLHPWRKGPFEVFGIPLDTEWRSDWKWGRVKDALDPLPGRLVLDVGCGNGYYGWRMVGAGADLVLGIDPTLVYVMQYQALQRYIGERGNYVLPLGMEAVPDNLRAFDTVFSMGVLYHRRSPMDHLLALRQTLRPGGQLVLETLVIDGPAGQVLVPEGRYAKMRNVWFLPSPGTLEQWLRRCRFTDVQTVDVAVTRVEEQHSTPWMQFESLPDFLDPNDHAFTIEGLPAPRRAVLVARAPA